METRGIERAVWVGLAAVIAVVALAGIWSLRGRDAAAAPPVIAPLPPFTLTERSGRPLSLSDLAGEPWVADFVFTQCSGMCPALSTRMAELQRQVHEHGLRARFVSFSVDPTHDTPEVLREYAARFAADPGWLFVTGDREAIHGLIGQGFRLSVAERTPGEGDDAGELITHSDRFVLVDAQGRIRGYYHGIEPETVPALLRDLAALQATG